MAFGFGFGMPRSFAVPPFSPASLFAGGIPGVWYDPSDYGATGTLFQDSAGTTPVTAVEQPVGLMLDKSQGLVLGPTLVTNGDFSNGTTGWTAPIGGAIAVVGGALEVTSSGGGFGSNQNLSGLTIGKFYKVTFIAKIGTAASVTVRATLLNTAGTIYAESKLVTSDSFVSEEFVFQAPATTASIYCRNNTSSVTGFFDNISVKELPGNHAFQATSASRPVLSARYNLLTKTEQFDDAAWNTRVNVTVGVNSITAPDGTLTADTLIETAATGAHFLAQGPSAVTPSGSYSISVYAKVKERSILCLGQTSGTVTPINTSRVWFNLATGTVGTASAGYTGTIENVGDGWYRCTATATFAVSTGPIAPFVGISTSDNQTTYTGDGTSGLYVWGAQLESAT